MTDRRQHPEAPQPKPHPQQKKANDPATLRCDNEPCLFHHLGICHFACHMWQPCASHTPAHPPEAQQRVDAAIKELEKLSKAKWDAAERTKNITFSYEGIGVDEAIALLQAGDPK